MKRTVVLSALLLSLGLSACVPLVVIGGVAAGAWIGSDPRKTAVIKEDTALGANISAKIIDEWKELAHVNVNTFSGAVLLTGELPSIEAQKKAVAIAKSFPQTRKVYDETVVGPVSSAVDRLNDTQLTTRVKSAVMLQVKDGASVHVQVITERGVVYLLGVGTPEVANQIATVAASVSGVQQVVKLVEPTLP
ncbi:MULTISPECIES: BON domain-containing protein [Deefgea]|uniref:BON domain-containing protein n=1 Tax=Deefgea chitinilytica TaxID=570276 RepID=A0ABS2CE19_9NEIS|nr:MULTISPECIES: BON domain-containing protein [Deefgea]MBM5572307.1 BON domain-containing protein [Deefgea chitinilytica]MBM9889543.1 BON domain-containing protein [Deefgea sp. CFH1-16]